MPENLGELAMECLEYGDLGSVPGRRYGKTIAVIADGGAVRRVPKIRLEGAVWSRVHRMEIAHLADHWMTERIDAAIAQLAQHKSRAADSENRRRVDLLIERAVIRSAAEEARHVLSDVVYGMTEPGAWEAMREHALESLDNALQSTQRESEDKDLPDFDRMAEARQENRLHTGDGG